MHWCAIFSPMQQRVKPAVGDWLFDVGASSLAHSYKHPFVNLGIKIAWTQTVTDYDMLDVIEGGWCNNAALI